MNTQNTLLLVEEFSEKELEAVSGGQDTLINVSNIRVPVDVDVRDINVAVQALASRSFQRLD